MNEKVINCPACGSIDVVGLTGEDYEYACLNLSCEEWFDDDDLESEVNG